MSDPTPAAEDGGPAPAPKPTAMLLLEQRLGYGLAGLGAAFSGIAVVQGAVLLGCIGLVAAGLLALAVRHAHRIITCFAALLAGFLVGYLPLEVLFMAYSGFIMLRVSKAQGQQRAAQPRMSPRERREAKEARAAAKRGDARTGATGPATRLPAANRRYTPPKPKPGRKH